MASTVTSIVETLTREIRQGLYGASGTGILPPRTQLAKRFHTSNETVGKAVMYLRATGTVEPHGRNIVIRQQPVLVPGLTPSFDGFLEEQGLTPHFENIGEPELLIIDGEMRHMFHLTEDTEAIKRVRLQGTISESNHISWYRLAETYYPRSLMHDEWLEEIRTNARFILTNALKEATGKEITHAHSELVTRFPNEQEQNLLTITFQTPIIEHRRVCRAANNEIIMLNRIVLVAHRFVFGFDYTVSF